MSNEEGVSPALTEPMRRLFAEVGMDVTEEDILLINKISEFQASMYRFITERYPNGYFASCPERSLFAIYEIPIENRYVGELVELFLEISYRTLLPQRVEIAQVMESVAASGFFQELSGTVKARDPEFWCYIQIVSRQPKLGVGYRGLIFLEQRDFCFKPVCKGTMHVRYLPVGRIAISP